MAATGLTNISTYLAISDLGEILEVVNDPSVIFAKDGKLLSSNRAFRDLLGYSEEELSRSDAADLLCDDGSEMLDRPLHEPGQLEGARVDAAFRHKNGSQVTANCSIKSFGRDRGVLLLIVLGLKSGLRNHPRELADEATFYRTLLDHAGVGIGHYDLQGRIVVMNQTACGNLGVSISQLIGKKAHEVFPAGIADTIMERISECVTRESQIEFKDLIDLNGKQTWYLSTYRHIRDERGESLGVQIISKDITQLVEQKAKLDQYSRLLDTAQSIARLGAWVWDLKKGAGDFSDNSYLILGRTKEQGMPDKGDWAGILHPDDMSDYNRVFEDSVRGESPFEITARFLYGPEQEVRYLHSVAEIVQDECGRPVKLVGFFQDVTEQIESRHSLEEAYRRLRFAEELAQVGWWEIDLRTNRAISSDQLLKVIGAKPHEYVTQDDWLGIIHEGDRERCRMEIESACAGKSDYESNYRVIDQTTGKTRNIYSIARLQIDESGKPVKLFGMAQDITDFVAAWEAAERSEALRWTAEEQGKFGSYEADLITGQTTWSPQLKTIIGIGDRDEIGDMETFLGFVHPEDRDRIRAVIEQSLAEGKNYSLRYRLLRQNDGKIIQVSDSGAIDFDDSGRPLVAHGVVRDCTAVVKAQQLLEEITTRFQSLFENSRDMILISSFNNSDTVDRIKKANPAALKVWGYSMRELIELPWSDLIDSDPETDRQMAEKLLQGTPQSYDRNLITKLGERIPVEFSVTPLENEDERLLLVIGRDLRERKRLEAEMLSREKLESIGILAGGIAHDFNNLLVPILGTVSWAKETVMLGSEFYEAFRDVEAAALRARDLTRQLLTFAKGGKPNVEVIDPREIISEAVRFSMHGSHAVCRCSIDDDLASIEADASQISQVLNNIIINANQSMLSGGTIRVTASRQKLATGDPSQLPEGEYVEIKISDEGTGISEDAIDKIFDPFFTTKDLGSGLGLATSYSIIREHGGKILVDSEVGRGTTFTILLPASEAKTSRKHSKEQRVDGAGARILVVDDETSVRDVIRLILGKRGFEVVAVASGQAGVDTYQRAIEEKQSFEAVIMDLTIPGELNGIESFKRIKAMDPEAIGIVSSGYSNSDVMSRFQQFGFSGRLSKPFKANDLLGIVIRVLSEHQKKNPARA